MPGTADSTAQVSYSPGLTIEVRDELWMITQVTRSTDGFRLNVRGLSDYVKDHTSVFYTALDDVRVLDPTNVMVVPDDSPGFRKTRLWLETTMRQTPVPLYQDSLSVADRMLADPLDYQLSAVKKALSPDNLRPRVLIADAVGLGKTLEIGMILAELIRRGRGERILVVTPRHIMEQFQNEIWSRFAIPLVRLDSVGIQKVRQKLPASRNPFTYFPRVIISLDTLKSPKYRAQLEKVRWDAVVMDEIHNATNVGTQNNALARTLAPTTEALLLASATPHNGNEESFKEILRLLDPTSVMPDGTIDSAAAQRLIIRRHRHSPEVAGIVGAKWAERAEPRNIPVAASAEEDAVAREIHDTWVRPGRNNPVQDRLFPWTLVKAFLSSPAALGETIGGRLERTNSSAEKKALERLAQLNGAVSAQNSNKLAALVDYLVELGVKKGSDTRVVIFSERVATLHWLKENLTKHMKLPKAAVEVMHGGLSDQEQMRLVDDFKRSDSPIRVLVTGDVASEGVNLHALCHDLIHYDIPWSLIRIQQRNGRIDRYGQTQTPQIATLLLDTTDAGSVGELHVLTKLVEREFEAHKLLGDASSLMGKHSVAAEEDEIRDVLRGVRDFDATVADPNELAEGEGDDQDIDWLLNLLGRAGDDADSDAQGDADAASAAMDSSLYDDEVDFLEDALAEGFFGTAGDPPARGGVAYAHHSNDVLELEPPLDLQRRLDFLPQDYLEQRQVKDKLVLAASSFTANLSLTAARTGDDGSTWPQAHFLGPLHPVTEWATDRALSRKDRRTIPAFTGDVEEPTVILMATLSNKRGQIIARTMLAARNRWDAQPLPDPIRWLRDTGLNPKKAVNTGTTEVPADTASLIDDAVQAATNAIQPMIYSAEQSAKQRVAEFGGRAKTWDDRRRIAQTTATVKRSASLIDEENSLAQSFLPDRQLVRPLAVVVPK